MKPEKLQQPMCTYRRPLVLEEAGRWTVRARLRQTASDAVTEWQTYEFQIKQGAVADKKVPVIRCIVRTHLDMMSTEFASSYEACQRAMEGALGVPALTAQVMQATFKWPEVDIHFAIHESSCDHPSSAPHEQHPMEEVLHKLREPRLIASLAEGLRREGVQVRTGLTAMLGCHVRTLVFHEIAGFLKPKAPKPACESLPTALDLFCFRSLFVQPGRVQSKAQFAAHDFDSGQWIECFFSLPLPLFKSALSFLA
mmetsp:Transcript_107037/g.185421  ORF Transcript_107037/g.185421 Transcript_107037/m.185421 type:complete len:254 (+) Transcript_107037:3-764(+)